jgi:hypothetical protein
MRTPRIGSVHENREEVRVFMTNIKTAKSQSANRTSTQCILRLRSCSGAMDRQAPQQKCDEWFGVVMY